MFKIQTLALGALLGAAAFTTSNAKAADWDVNVSFGKNRPVFAPVPPQTHIHREWVPGRYETRTERILIAPERHEKVWVPPVYETRYERHRGHYHTTQVLVAPGYYKDVCIPARYDTRVAQVWVPGFYREVAHTTRPSYPYPTFGGPRNDRFDRNDRDFRNDSPRGGYVSVDFRK
jgi:hypothetical protein